MKNITILIVFTTILAFTRCGEKEEWKKRTVYQVLTDRIWRDDGSTKPCPDLGRYCGGTWKGIQKQLDYIEGMGFDAVWISPVVKNVESPFNYHGYSALNFDELNEHFGTEQDFVDLVSDMHSRGMWIMVDVVANHVGPVDLDFSTIVPFNLPEYYHEKCQINPEDWGHNQWRVENCRLANLPDLAQENSFVRNYLLNWVKNLVTKYKIDGLRVDTVPEVPHDFWKDFADAAGVYTVGECYDGRPDFVASYQGKLDGLFNYPLFFKQNDVFVWENSMYGIREQLQSTYDNFPDPDALGLFADNHDQPRFLHQNGDWNRLKNCLSFIFFARGIPFLYYGTEQGYAGGADPDNREQLWTNIDPNHELYKFISLVVGVRKKYNIWTLDATERYVDDTFYTFSRGKVLISTTNSNSGELKHQVTYLPYSEGETVCNIFWNGDCVTVTNGALEVDLDKGETKIFLPKQQAEQIWVQFNILSKEQSQIMELFE